MSVWRRLGSLFRGRGRGREDPNVIVLYVRCDACREIIRVRADRRWDLMQELDDPATTYVLHKDVLGSKCNRMMSIHVGFDPKGTIVRQDAEGASFVTAEEYAAAQAGRNPP